MQTKEPPNKRGPPLLKNREEAQVGGPPGVGGEDGHIEDGGAENGHQQQIEVEFIGFAF